MTFQPKTFVCKKFIMFKYNIFPNIIRSNSSDPERRLYHKEQTQKHNRSLIPLNLIILIFHITESSLHKPVKRIIIGKKRKNFIQYFSKEHQYYFKLKTNKKM